MDWMLGYDVMTIDMLLYTTEAYAQARGVCKDPGFCQGTRSSIWTRGQYDETRSANGHNRFALANGSDQLDTR